MISLIVSVLALGTIGQGMPMPPGMDVMTKPLLLLQRVEIEKELKLDGKQKSEIKKVIKEYNDEVQKLSKEGMQLLAKFEPMTDEYGRKAVAHLNDAQKKRLTEIVYQCEGGVALARPEVSDALELDQSQRETIADLVVDVRKNRMSFLMNHARDPKKMKDELDKYRKQTEETLLKVLTEAQQAKWKTMQGEPFKDLKKIVG